MLERRIITGNGLTLKINGGTYEFTIGRRLDQIPESETLLETLWERIKLTGAKMSCGQEACGCCAVLMDGKAAASCITFTAKCGGKRVVTIEGLNDPVTGELGPVQEAFLSRSAFQCGFCAPGIIIAVKSLLNRNPSPIEEGIKDVLSGNYYRCISHHQVIGAVKSILQRRE